MDLLKNLAQECVEDTERWFGDKDVNNLPFMALALAGEVGEVANLVKKIERGSVELGEVADNLDEEIVDVFTYLLNIAGLRGLDLHQGYKNKRALNELRFNKSNVAFGD